ncbi:MAG: ROK family protein [Deltaproteobacteria bacterium]|nr:ROK family protein [Deltaproteobacteria bacterium]
MSDQMHPVIAVDVGGTNMRGARVAPQGRILARTRVPTPVAGGPDAILETLVRLCRTLAGHAKVAAVGLGVPGAVSQRRGVVFSSPNIPCWRDEPIGPRLARRLGLPVLVDNDANLHALGEHWLGAGRDVPNLVLATLGTGIGGGIVLRGRLWHGDAGRAGELGHTVVDPDGPRCGCGANGCVEAYASATGIVRAWRYENRVSPSGTGARTRAVLRDTPETIAARARRGDPRALAVFAEAGRALGVATASWLQVLDVHTVVFGGGVAGALDLLEPLVRLELDARLFGLESRRIRILHAALGDDAGILGAARLALGKGGRAPGLPRASEASRGVAGRKTRNYGPGGTASAVPASVDPPSALPPR